MKATTQQKPKFAIGQKVTMLKPNLYKETSGIITGVDRLFKEVDENGYVRYGGLVTTESSIKSICLPYTFENDVLIVEHPETKGFNFTIHAHQRKSVFHGYAYTVKTEKINSMYPEKLLK